MLFLHCNRKLITTGSKLFHQRFFPSEVIRKFTIAGLKPPVKMVITAGYLYKPTVRIRKKEDLPIGRACFRLATAAMQSTPAYVVAR